MYQLRMQWLSLLACLLMAGCGGRTVTSVLPSIQSFQAEQGLLLKGGSTRLTAVFVDGSGTITPNIGPVTSGVPVSTGALSSDTTFTLTVTSPRGFQVESQLTVKVQAFAASGTMGQERLGHTSTLLPDGRVLIAGGENDAGDVLSTAELYDPAKGTFTPTGAMLAAREFHTATLLNNGKVLVVGGYGGEDAEDLSTAELYDPQAGTFSATGGLQYGVGLELHTATLLTHGPHAGKVLIAGGYSADLDDDNVVTQLYDPATGRFTLHALMQQPRSGHLALSLADGSILVVGGYSTTLDEDLADVEVYQPASGAFQKVGSMQTGRYGACAALLPDGRVLVAGGETLGEVHASSEIYEPASRTFRQGPALGVGRSFAHLVSLPNGHALLCGGYDPEEEAVATSEVFTIAEGRFVQAPSLLSPRALGMVTTLKDGRVLLSGGTDGSRTLASAELFR